MANNEQLELILQSVEHWNAWRDENPDIQLDFAEADLTGVNLNYANLNQADLRMAILDDASLVGARLREANLTGANLNRTILHKANIWGGILRSAVLIDANLSEVTLWGADLNNATLQGAILENADLGRADLIQANLSRARLQNVNLSGANLCNTDLTGTDLFQSDLSEAVLSYANFRGTNLREADLSRADLRGASFWGTDLAGCILTGTRFNGTTFGDVDLSDVIGIQDARHWGPSSVSMITLRKSKGKVPAKFLQGCGFSDSEIEFAKLTQNGLDRDEVTSTAYTLVNIYCGAGIRFYTCFISYSSEDEGFSKKLHDDLQNHGVRCWFAPEDMKIGDRIRVKIDQEIRLRDKLIVIISENSVMSEWVGDEVEAALEEEGASDKTILFPLRLDNAVFNVRQDWAAKVRRRRHIGDFSDWHTPNKYIESFNRLLRDLRMSDTE